MDIALITDGMYKGFYAVVEEPKSWGFQGWIMAPIPVLLSMGMALVLDGKGYVRIPSEDYKIVGKYMRAE